MTGLKSEFLQILTEREFIHQATDLEALDAKMYEGPIAAISALTARRAPSMWEALCRS
nr:hypothetical protein [Kordiimonas gwangyangensis]